MPSVANGDSTMVDVRPAQPKLPRVPKASTPPPNVIPFAKPRALAAAAAAPSSHRRDTVVDRAEFASEEATVAEPARRFPVAAPAPAPAWKPTMPAARTPAPSTPWDASDNAATTQAPQWGHRPAVSQPARALGMPDPGSARPAPALPPAGPAIAFGPPTVVVAGSIPPMAAVPPMGHAPNLPPLPALPVAAEPVMLPSPPPKHDPHKWAIYDKLGLGAPKLKIDSKKFAKWVVSAYRLLGFVILTIIVVVLVGYIATTAFFYVSNSWTVPMAVSPQDEKVVALQAQVAEQMNTRDRLADEINQADRSIASQQQFQAEFAKAIKSDLDGQNKALGKIKALASAASATRAQIRAQSSAYAAASNRRMADEYKAGLIDRNSMLSGKFQVAQISSSNLGLAERQAEYETRAAELEQNAKSLDALLANVAGDDTALSYEVLKIKQELEASRLELAKMVENRNTLKSSLDRQDKLIASLEGSAYLRAIKDKATVTFVPYSNLSEVKQGEKLYACKLGMIVCFEVGEVMAVLPGEVQFKHPHKDKQLRGQMVEVKLNADDVDAAEEDVLFVGGKPLLF